TRWVSSRGGCPVRGPGAGAWCGRLLWTGSGLARVGGRRAQPCRLPRGTGRFRRQWVRVCRVGTAGVHNRADSPGRPTAPADNVHGCAPPKPQRGRTVPTHSRRRPVAGELSRVGFMKDLYRYVNGPWLDSHIIPNDRAVDGTFHKLRDDAEEDVHEIVKEDQGRAGAIYASFMDTDAINDLGVKAIDPDLDRLSVANI